VSEHRGEVQSKEDANADDLLTAASPQKSVDAWISEPPRLQDTTKQTTIRLNAISDDQVKASNLNQNILSKAIT
jgi:hypothetical protein